MTVSLGAEHPRRLQAETLARVQAAIAETNYVPTCRRRRSAGRAPPSTIGVLALDTVTTPFSVEITLSIEETARAHGWNSFVVNMFSDDRPEAIGRPAPLPPSGRHYLYHHGPAPGTTAGKLLTLPACGQLKASASRWPAISRTMNRGSTTR